MLTGTKITDMPSALEAMTRLHNMGAKTVVISSSDLGSDETLIGLASTVASVYKIVRSSDTLMPKCSITCKQRRILYINHQLSSQVCYQYRRKMFPSQFHTVHILDGKSAYIRIEMPRLPAQFTGTGDLFAALLLAWLHDHPDDLKVKQ